MRTLISIIALVLVVAFGGEALAQGTGVSIAVETIVPTSRSTSSAILATGGPWLYSAKYLCGTITPSAVSPDLGDPLAPGTYLTAINIHNASGSGIVFQKKAVETRSQRESRGEVGNPVTEQLGPDQGLEVDCQDIVNLLFPPGTTAPDLTKDFIKGFVLITAPGRIQPLDVIGVYTTHNLVSSVPSGRSLYFNPGFNIIGGAGTVLNFGPFDLSDTGKLRIIARAFNNNGGDIKFEVLNWDARDTVGTLPYIYSITFDQFSLNEATDSRVYEAPPPLVLVRLTKEAGIGANYHLVLIGR